MRSLKVSGFISFVAITALTAVPLPAGMSGRMTTMDLSMQPARAAVIPAVSTGFVQISQGEPLNKAAVPRQSGTETVYASCQGGGARAARPGTIASLSDFDANVGPGREPAC